jgi:geranylgeranylglycerol-phosphate geranylgeranyltransferase
MLTARNLIDLIIPHYLIITVVSPLTAWLIISGLKVSLQLPFAIISLSFAMLGFNAANMVFDRKLDKLSKPRRPIPSGRVKTGDAGFLSLTFYFLSLALAYLIGGVMIITIAAFLLVSFLYTYPPIYLKKYFWGTSIIGAIIYGAIPFLAAWSVSDSSIPLEFLLFYSLLVFFVAPSKDIEDMKGENKYKIDSIPIRLGIKNTVLFIFFGVFTVLVSMMVLGLMGKISINYSYAALASAVLYYMLNAKYVHHIKKLKDHSVITQSKYVSVNMLSIVLIQAVFSVAGLI